MRSLKMIAIVDYGMGNIHSVQKALELQGAKAIVTNKPKDILASDKVVLPGVGAFDDAILDLKKQDLIQALSSHIKNKKIFLGICLGMQLLFEGSQEAEETSGLGILKGRVEKFKPQDDLKVPHMGWNQLKITRAGCPFLKGIEDNPQVYFCHSYYPQPLSSQVIAATCDYGTDFAAIVWQDNIFGVQFHPEKSQEVGLRMLKNFVSL